jgi:signal-transduction protein with cAMP-binding, CBS, and nucleotidyltransferase domain
MPTSQPIPASPQSREPTLLEQEVGDVMTAGVITLSDAAPIERVAEAMVAHRVHAILLVASDTGKPTGWATAHSLMRHRGSSELRKPARTIVDEEITSISPTAFVRSAVYALALPEVNRLLVRRKPGIAPEGVLTETDIALVNIPEGR